jgi:hypothetical protein
MNPSPPPSASPSRTSPPCDGTQGFVTALAWITIALGGLGIGYGLLQTLLAALLPTGGSARLLDPLGGGQLQLPPLLRWSMDHDLQIGLVELLGSALSLWLGWGLLRRAEWARRGLIACLVVGSLMIFGTAWLVPALVEATVSMQLGLQSPGRPLPPELAGIKTWATAFGAVLALVFAALHGAIIRKLCTAAVRAQFTRTR